MFDEGPEAAKVPKPGDYDLGSLESRAAARALLDAKLTGDQQNRARVVIRAIGHSGKPVICSRSLWSDGTIFEMVELDGSSNVPKAVLEQFICKLPVDGKKYALAETE